MRQRAQIGKFEIICLGALLLVIASILFFEWEQPFIQGESHLVAKNGIIRAICLLLLFLLTNLLSKSQGLPLVACGALMLILVWWDLAYHVPQQNPTAQAQVYSAGWAREQLNLNTQLPLGQSRAMLAPAADDTLRRHALPGLQEDYLVKRLAFFADSNLLDGLPQVFGFFSLAPGGIAELANLPYVQTNLHLPGLLDFMGVSHMTASGTLYNWVERPTAMPLITVGQKPLFADDDIGFATLLQTNVDLRKIVLLPPEALPSSAATGFVAARVLNSHFESRQVTARAETPAPTVVVISQSYYPAWKAYVDGRETKILRANYAFQAVQVPAGNHQVVLRYEDKALLLGAVLTCLGVLFCLGFWILANCRKAYSWI